jgi:hypothetical protein
MGSETYERKLTDDFFNSEIGRTVKEAIYNNMTIVCHNNPCFITGGEYKSNDISIIYEPDTNKPVIRTDNIWYHDTLLPYYDSIPPIHIHNIYSTSNGKCIKYFVNGIRPFNLIWTTIIIVNNEPVNTYIRKIKVIPKDESTE